MKIITDTLKAFFMTIMILLLVWMVISWLNVGFNNSSPETIQNIWSWNFFVVVSKLF